MLRVLVLMIAVNHCLAFLEQYETDQHRHRQEINDMVELTKAKQMIYKMKNGIGGVTVVIHRPSGHKFIHRNKWILTCNGEISPVNGHCNGDALESLTALKPQRPADFCFVKNFASANQNLCLSTHPVRMWLENNRTKCESVSGLFPVYVVKINDYLRMCEKISSDVVYIYFSNPRDIDHVEIPNGNDYVKCDNKAGQSKNESLKHGFRVNEPGICVFTENDNMSLKLLDFLKM
ncbi:uncharacterized protein LOC132696177 [Cylas formicarius]|uniref:uncharacterized protein LOC132696177 n=1 Tax=Cylas formicarius TaxID=197179 RepID=UPI002958861A|nr:uncharacterized protein LOC132696177 [Cylas formicarius]